MESVKMEPIEVKEAIRLDDGSDQGVVQDVVPVERMGYEYIDVLIKDNNTQAVLKYSCPNNLTQETKLGRLLANFIDLNVGSKIDLENVLEGQLVNFIVVNKPSKKDNTKVYANIVDDSVKPVKQEVV